MGWRTVVITKGSKLDLKLNNLVIRSIEDVIKINLEEIEMLILESNQISITSCLLVELSKQKIPTVFCDDKHIPISSLLPFYGCHDCSKKVLLQTKWTDHQKAKIWSIIVYNKIFNQKKLLEDLNKNQEAIDLLDKYLDQIEDFDSTNREGLAAKVYFSALFGKDFKRGENDIINTCLNYGYQILLSSFIISVKANGYITELGIFHSSQHNYYNLASDLMEPFRIIIDKFVYEKNFDNFDTNEKRELQNILNQEIEINGRKQTVNNAINIYTKSILDVLSENNEEGEIKFIKI